MPENLNTSFENFVKKETKLTKQEIENQIIECLTNSDMKMSTYDISKATGIKPDKIYIILAGKVKSKNVNQVLRWYVNENQKDPLPIKTEKKKEDALVKGLFENLKDDGNRKIFLTMDDYQNYKNKDNEIVKAEKKVRRRKR